MPEDQHKTVKYHSDSSFQRKRQYTLRKVFLQAQNVGIAYFLPLFAHGVEVSVSLSYLVNQRLLIVCFFYGFVHFLRISVYSPSFFVSKLLRKPESDNLFQVIRHNILWYLSGIICTVFASLPNRLDDPHTGFPLSRPVPPEEKTVLHSF